MPTPGPTGGRACRACVCWPAWRWRALCLCCGWRCDHDCRFSDRHRCDAKMDHVRKATVRDLRYHFPEIENLLQEGEEVQITKRKRVIARLVPERPAAPAALPDLMALLQEINENKNLKARGADLIRVDRDRY